MINNLFEEKEYILLEKAFKTAENLIEAAENIYDRSYLKNQTTLKYHNNYHTMDEVFYFCKMAVSPIINKEHHAAIKHKILLLIAALFHDTGLIFCIENHEEESAKLARAFMTSNGCEEKNIKLVEQCIINTNMKEWPSSIEASYLRDADLFCMGKENFFTRNNDLRKEIIAMGDSHPFYETANNKEKWKSSQFEFIKSRKWFTVFAENELGEQKNKNSEKEFFDKNFIL